MKNFQFNKKFKLFKLEFAVIFTGIFILLICNIAENSQKNSDKFLDLSVNSGEFLSENEVYVDFSKQYEMQIERILSNIEGIGKVSAAVYVKSEGTEIPAINKSNDNSVISEKSGENTSAEEVRDVKDESVVILKDSQGNESVFCTKRTAPEIVGIAVCVKGGVNNTQREKILNALMALYDISSSKICITG